MTTISSLTRQLEEPVLEDALNALHRILKRRHNEMVHEEAKPDSDPYEDSEALKTALQMVEKLAEHLTADMAMDLDLPFLDEEEEST